MVTLRRVTTPLIVAVSTMHLVGCDYFTSPEERVARAERHIASGNDRGAFIELQNAVRREPGLVQARLMLAELSLRLGDPKGAEQELTLAVQHGASREQAAVLGAQIRVAQNQYGELLTWIDSGQSGLDEADGATFRGIALLRTGRTADAIAALERALTLRPDSSHARVVLSQILASTGKTSQALEMLEAALSANARDAAALQTKGTILLRHGEFNEAVASLAAAREHSAGQLSAAEYAALLAALTEAHLGAGTIAKAEGMHEQLARRAPDAPVTRVLSARIALAKQDYAAAVAEAQKALATVPGLAQAKYLLGVALIMQGNLHQAEAQLAELVQMMPENAEARKLLARVNLQLQRPDVAMQLLTPLQQNAVEDPQLAALTGVANLQRGDHEAGIAMLESSVARDPANVELKHDLALAYIAARQNDKALKLLRSMPANDPRRESLMVSLLAVTEGVPAARARIEQMVASEPANADVLNQAAVLFARLGDVDRARTTLQTALKLHPRSVPTLITLARLESTTGRSTEALDAAKQALAMEPTNRFARLVIADVAARTGDADTAIQQLEQVRSSDPKAVEARIALARGYAQQHRMQESNAVVRELETIAQSNARVAGAVGAIYLETGRPDDALRWFRHASRLDASDPALALNVARTQLAMGEKGAARESLLKLIDAHPKYVAAAAELIVLDFQENRREAALERLAKLRAEYSKDVTVMALEGDLAMASKSYQAAAAAYDAAAKLAPSGALAIRAHRARQQGGLPNANEPLLAWLGRHPEDAAVRLALASSYETAGDTNKAIEQYEMLTQGERPNPMALNNLAWHYHLRGDARAKQTAKAAYELAPQVAAIADTYGWILVQTGEADTGLPILEKAAASGSEAEIRFHYAVALARVGKRDAARQELGELIRTNGQFPSAAEARKLLAELGG
jgi:putative PEP-CTERM system TPR-repeat lipoprotein